MKQGALIVLLAGILLTGAGFVVFERKKTSVYQIVLIAVMTAMSIAGRFVFAVIPGFKPVTAIVVITGMYLGCEGGFFCGALSALITNFYFGQGPWTLFQMLIWGLLGIAAGVLAKPLKRSRVFLAFYGVCAGIVFSLFMDIYSTIWMAGTFRWSVYLTMIASSLSFTVIYAVSNVIFLTVLAGPIGRKISHAYIKYNANSLEVCYNERR